MVLDHAKRIQELCLNVIGEVFPTKLSLNAPRLHILDIAMFFNPPERTFTINDGDTAPLRMLKLNSYPLPWHSTFNLRGVTTLSRLVFLLHPNKTLWSF